MSTYFHVAAGAAIAVGSRKALSIPVCCNEMLVWMLVLVLASNLADKDMIWAAFLRRWAAKPSTTHRELRWKDFLLRWFDHRKFSHSFVALVLDLFLLLSLCSVLQQHGLLPSLDPTPYLFAALALHIVVDTIDGSEGVALFAPFSDRMCVFPGLFQDLSWEAMRSPCPKTRRSFWLKVKWETALSASLSFPAYFGPLWF